MRNLLSLLWCTLCLFACSPKANHLTILHTNDTHSQILPNNKKQGGYARRMGVIREEREKDPNLLLLDAGDFSQGTPFFNFYHGRVEIDALNRMGYDVTTLGNHEFDNGLDTLATILRGAKFDVVCANYDVTGTVLEGLVKPYTILRRGGLKIGVFGLGVNPVGLITERNFAPVRYLEPYAIAQETADLLRNDKHCDVVICLSHMGSFTENEGDKCDAELASLTRGIDVIIGGHTHKFYDNLRVANLDGDSIPLCQMAKSGAFLGKIILDIAQ